MGADPDERPYVASAVAPTHIRWHAHGGPDKVPNGLALCALHHRLFDHRAITARAPAGAGRAGLAGGSARTNAGARRAGRIVNARLRCDGYPTTHFSALMS